MDDGSTAYTVTGALVERRRFWRGLAGSALVAQLLLAACSEKTQIHTNPAGAEVEINGRNLGSAPVELRVKSWSVRPNSYRYHVEKPGYVAQDGYIQPHLSMGRIITAASLWCLTCSFHGFYEFDQDTEIVLQPDTPPTQAIEDPLAVQLRRLQDLYDQGLISKDELHQSRADVLRGVVSPPSKPEHNSPALPDFVRQLLGPVLQPTQ